MRLISFRAAGVDRYGVVANDGVVDAHARLHQEFATLQDVLWAGAVARLQPLVEQTPDFALAEIEHLRPVLWPEKIACIGVNYVNRNAEYRDGSEAPKYPSLFMRTPDSLVGHGAPLLRPPESEQFDYEGEIAIIVGKPGRRIEQAQALAHIAGITCMNEGSVRDWLRHAKFNVTQGKNFVASGALGPWLVTADEIADFDALTVTTRVNGETRQHDTTANLAFSFRYLISYLSTFFLLKPGDIIATGTPVGAGARFDPPKYLRAGDRVEVEVPQIGVLSNPVVDETV